MLLYGFLPLMALAVRYKPWLATVVLIGIGLGWRATVAYDGDWLRDFYFGRRPLDPGIQSLFIARQFIGARRHLRAGDHGQVARGARPPGPVLRAAAGPARRELVHAADASRASRCSYWVEEGIELHQPPVVHGLRLRDHAGAGARTAAGRPAAVVPGQSAAQPCRTWLGERSYSIYLWHFPIILAVYERGPLKRLPAAGRLLLAAAVDPRPDAAGRDRQLPHGRAARHGVRPPPRQAGLGGRRADQPPAPARSPPRDEAVPPRVSGPPQPGPSPPRPYVGEELAACITDAGQLWIPASDGVMRPFLEERGTWEPEEGALLAQFFRPGAALPRRGRERRLLLAAGRPAGCPGAVIHAFEPHPLTSQVLALNAWSSGARHHAARAGPVRRRPGPGPDHRRLQPR